VLLVVFPCKVVTTARYDVLGTPSGLMMSRAGYGKLKTLVKYLIGEINYDSNERRSLLATTKVL
jgi:hypothetical protein